MCTNKFLAVPEPNQPDDETNLDDAKVQFPNNSQRIIVFWVLGVGAFGGLFIKYVPIKGIDVSTLSWWQSVLVGAIGAFLSVFYVAKTDLRKFWNVICVALLCGISGPSVLESIVKPTSAGDSAAVAQEAANSAGKLQDTSAGTDPAMFQKAVDDTTKKAATSLQLFKVAAATNPDEKKEQLAKTEEALRETLQNLDAAKEQSPRKILPAVAQIAMLAKESGADSVASQAQQIITNAQNSDKSAVKEAANAPDVSHDATKLYFITPEPLTDSRLQQIQSQIAQNFPMVSIQPTVHPKRTMETGLEVVYYNNADASLAQQLLDLVKRYAGVKEGTTRKGTTSDGSQPSQVDVHLGPDIDAKWPWSTAAPAVTPAATVGLSPAASPADSAKTRKKSSRR